jgi:lipopolysaccharide/colanic/teichoic acid biosynthesis glycosyltransferase
MGMSGTSIKTLPQLDAAPFWSRAFRRAVDITLSAIGLIVFSPVFLVLAIAIGLEDGFPIFFRQARVGWRGDAFSLVKFRTMRRSNQGALITAGGDPRITKLGRFLRGYKLDELPQLWNVLKGEMSLVGCRPEVSRYVDQNHPAWQRILMERPGITGFASLVFRNEEDLLAQEEDPERAYRERILPHKLALNVEYLDQRSLLTDWKVLLMTLNQAFFFQKTEPRKTAPQETLTAAIRKSILEHPFKG